MGAGGGPRRTPPTGSRRALGLVSNHESGRRIHAGRFAPPDDLADIVDCFWEGAWDLRGQHAHESRLLADPCINIVVESGDGSPGARIVGVWTRLWTRTLSGQGRVRGVKLRPGAAQALLPGAAGDFTNAIVPLVDVRPAAARELTSGHPQPPSPDAFAAWVRRWRRTRVEDGQRAAIDAVRLIERSPGLMRAADLAGAMGINERRLQRLFRAHVGASPKFVLRRRRLQEAADELDRGAALALAHLAAALGYSDQAHFTRDFRAATGMTPTAFRGQV